MSVIMQHALHSGEWAPALNARVDLLKYHSAAALMRNYFVDYRGGASSRPGSKYVLRAFDSTHGVRVVPFQLSPTVGYILEFGENYIRFHFQGQTVLETGINITGITQASPIVVTVANTYSVGDWVYISGVVGMTQVNGRYWRISARTAANITLQRLDGSTSDSTGYTAWSSGGTVQRVYTITSPYAGGDVDDLKFTQDGNKLYIFHPGFAPRVLTYIAANNWTLGSITFGPSISPPTALAFTTTLVAGPVTYSYIVTAVSAAGEESFEAGINMVGYQDFRTTPSSMNLSWTGSAGAVAYNVYRAPLAYNPSTFQGVPHGYIGTATDVSFIDGNLEADYSLLPPDGSSVIVLNPSTGMMYNQRLYVGAPPSISNAFQASRPGAPYNFGKSAIAQPDDAISAALSSTQKITIRNMVGMPSGLLFFTDKVVQQLNSGTPGAAATATQLEAQPQSYVGANDMPPIVANFNILFVQSKNSIVRDITYNFNANIFTGVDITILSSHLFFGYSLLEWGFAEEPFKLVWAIRSDGTLLSLTYLKEQELIGWAHHDTIGTYRSVATITEIAANGQTVDATYIVVERAGGARYIERMDDRFWTSLSDCWTVDNGLRYSGAASATIRGLDQLAGQSAYGLADGVPFGPITVSADGVLTLPAAASNVLAGHPFRPQLQTLRLELGEPTVQGKRKSISAVTVRVKDTLGLTIGSTLANAVPMKGLVIGNLNESMNAAVTGLVTDDARTIIDPGWTIPGQYFIDQPNPYPSTILGVIPEFTLGDGGQQK